MIFSIDGKPVQFKVIRIANAAEISNYLLNEIKNEEGGSFIEAITASFISGEDLSPSMVKTLQNTTGIEFLQFNPFEKIKPAPALIENRLYSDKFYSFSPAAGIAFRLA
jgi:hypothetical protein